MSSEKLTLAAHAIARAGLPVKNPEDLIGRKFSCSPYIDEKDESFVPVQIIGMITGLAFEGKDGNFFLFNSLGDKATLVFKMKSSEEGRWFVFNEPDEEIPAEFTLLP